MKYILPMAAGVLIMMMVLMSKVAGADEYYVYISNRTDVGNEIHEVIDVVPKDDINPPKWDYNNFNIILMELTNDERYELVGYDKVKDDLINKVKIDTSTLKKADDVSKTVYTKNDIQSNITSVSK